MTDDRRINDEALDAAIETTARVDAPLGLTARISALLDERAERGTGRGWPALAPRWALTLAAAALVIAAVAWWPRPAVVGPSVVGPNFSSAGGASPSVVGPSVAGPSFRLRGALRRTTVGLAQAVSSAAAPRRTPAHPATPDDHERALPALASIPEVASKAIAPDSLGVPALETAPTTPIVPLTIDTDRRDESGRGAYR